MHPTVTGRRVVFEAMYLEHYRAVLRFAERRLDDAQVAAEVAAEVFTVAWDRIGGGHEISLAWLYRTGANLISNHYRREARRRDGLRAMGEAMLQRVADGDGGTGLEVRLAMSRLGPREREVMALTYWEGLTAAEIAVVMDTSVSAVWTIQSRARSRLRAELSPAQLSGRSRLDGR